MKKPKRYHGFIHTLKDGDERIKKYKKQLKKRGFDDTESWDFARTTLAGFIYPRLKAFINSFKQPTTDHSEPIDFNDKLDQALRAFEILYEDMENGTNGMYTAQELEEINKGLHAFADVFLRLWN